MQTTEQQFLNQLESKLWAAANKLLPMLDAANYKHVVLGLIFIKYVSDAFKIRRDELIEHFKDPQHDYFLDPEEFDSEIALYEIPTSSGRISLKILQIDIMKPIDEIREQLIKGITAKANYFAEALL